MYSCIYRKQSALRSASAIKLQIEKPRCGSGSIYHPSACLPPPLSLSGVPAENWKKYNARFQLRDPPSRWRERERERENKKK